MPRGKIENQACKSAIGLGVVTRDERTESRADTTLEECAKDVQSNIPQSLKFVQTSVHSDNHAAGQELVKRMSLAVAHNYHKCANTETCELVVPCDCVVYVSDDLSVGAQALKLNTSSSGLIGAGKMHSVQMSVKATNALPATVDVIISIEVGHAGDDAEIASQWSTQVVDGDAV